MRIGCVVLAPTLRKTRWLLMDGLAALDSLVRWLGDLPPCLAPQGVSGLGDLLGMPLRLLLMGRCQPRCRNIETKPPGMHGATTRIVLACWHLVCPRWHCPLGGCCNSVQCIGTLAATRPCWLFLSETMMQGCWQCGVVSDAALPQCVSGNAGDELEMKAFAQ